MLTRWERPFALPRKNYSIDRRGESDRLRLWAIAGPVCADSISNLRKGLAYGAKLHHDLGAGQCPPILSVRPKMKCACFCARGTTCLMTTPDDFGIIGSDSITGLVDAAHWKYFWTGGMAHGGLYGGGRHRDHEHHAGQRYRTHARNRHSQSTGRAEVAHHHAIPGGIGGAGRHGRIDRRHAAPKELPGSCARLFDSRCPRRFMRW